MKHFLAWTLTGLWAVILLWFAWGYLRDFGTNPNLAKVDSFFAAVGAALVGCIPVFGAWQWHRFSQKRMHKTLTKQRDKIDRKLERLRSAPASAPTQSVSPPETSEARAFDR